MIRTRRVRDARETGGKAGAPAKLAAAVLLVFAWAGCGVADPASSLKPTAATSQGAVSLRVASCDVHVHPKYLFEPSKDTVREFSVMLETDSPWGPLTLEEGGLHFLEGTATGSTGGQTVSITLAASGMANGRPMLTFESPSGVIPDQLSLRSLSLTVPGSAASLSAPDPSGLQGQQFTSPIGSGTVVAATTADGKLGFVIRYEPLMAADGWANDGAAVAQLTVAGATMSGLGGGYSPEGDGVMRHIEFSAPSVDGRTTLELSGWQIDATSAVVLQGVSDACANANTTG